MKFVVYCDGACDPNPGGAAGYGFVVFQGMRRLREEAGPVGRGEGMTSNVAEYTALIRALEHVRGLMAPDSDLEIRADSELLVRQLNKIYAVRAEHIARLHRKVTELLEGIRWKAVSIPREENFEADKLSKQGLEQARSLPLAGRQSTLGGRR
jgi:ribonuclease HI